MKDYIFFHNPKCAGSTIHTLLPGESWHNIPSGVEENLRAPLEANNTIYISGRNGSIITSNDGGKSWQIEASHTAESLRVMAASPDGNHIIAAGRRIVVMDKNQQAQYTTQNIHSPILFKFRTSNHKKPRYCGVFSY